MAKFTFTPSSLPRLSRKAVLGIAAALAVTGATGAAALLAPSNVSDVIPRVSAQSLATNPTPDIMSQEPFDRVVQVANTPTTDSPTAPTSAPEAAQQPLPPVAATPRATETSPRAPGARRFARSTTRAPIDPPAAPIAQAPAADTEIAKPEGQMIPTAGPGILKETTRFAQTPITPAKQIIRKRVVHVHTPYCSD
jgi:hypothetical protein